MAKIEPQHGHIAGIPLRSLFRNRQALRDAHIHRPTMAGIDGNKNGAYCIVVSGGYVDDEDNGSEIIYTGQGGNDTATKRQVADQEWTRGNAGLRFNQEHGLPVRVVRGHKGDPPHAPAQGYRYDGLFLVEKAWTESGIDGFKICRFRLVEANELVPVADRTAEPWSFDSSPSSSTPASVPAAETDAAAKRTIDLSAVARPGISQDWVMDLLLSERFGVQMQNARRLPAARVQAVMGWLDANGGSLTHGELAAAIELPESRLRGLIAAIANAVNVDGYPVLIDAGDRIKLDTTLAKTQFGVT